MIPAPPELLLLAALIVFLAGASRIPQLGRSLGRATREVSRGREEIEQELEDSR